MSQRQALFVTSYRNLKNGSNICCVRHTLRSLTQVRCSTGDCTNTATAMRKWKRADNGVRFIAGITCPIYTLFSPLAKQPQAGQGRLILEVSISHTMTHHSRQDPSARVIGPSQRPLPDNTIHAPVAEFEPAIPARERPQTLALDRSATDIGYTDKMSQLQSMSVPGRTRNAFVSCRRSEHKLFHTKHRTGSCGYSTICQGEDPTVMPGQVMRHYGQHDRQCTHNVTMKRVRESLLP